jgi:DNA-directed RNA polymerase sigma subunit (sigma70/sigma32)
MAGQTKPALKEYAERFGFGRREVVEALADVELEPRERLVLALRSGFAWFQDWSLQEIADLEGVTRERIRVAEYRMCRKLWRAVKSRRETAEREAESDEED